MRGIIEDEKIFLKTFFIFNSGLDITATSGCTREYKPDITETGSRACNHVSSLPKKKNMPLIRIFIYRWLTSETVSPSNSSDASGRSGPKRRPALCAIMKASVLGLNGPKQRRDVPRGLSISQVALK